MLAVGTLLVSHETAYHIHHGGGAEFHDRMSALGHDSYWPAFSLLALSGLIVLALLGVARLCRLWLRSRSLDLPTGPPRIDRQGYRAKLLRLWSVLFPTTAIAFAIQENIEHLAAGKGLIWLEALGLAGQEYPFALLVLTLVSLLVAAVGSALSWHVASLEERVACALWLQLLRSVERTSPPVRWLIVSALCAHRWMRTRILSARAPPPGLPI